MVWLLLELVGALSERREQAPAQGPREVPRFSLGGTFEVLDIPTLLRRTEAFEPIRFGRRTIDGRRKGRVGVRSFRVELTRALVLPSLAGPRVLGQTRDGRAWYGPLPLRHAEAWSVPRHLELYVCGRVIEGWRPRGSLPASRAPAGAALGYPPEMVAVLEAPEALPPALRRWFIDAGGRSPSR